MNTQLELWLKQATRCLAKDSAARVRTEILEHYEAALEAAIGDGATHEAAERMAVTALGDARTANREYRRVLLTSAEAKLLRDGDREVRFVSSHGWMKALFLATPGVVLLVGLAFLFKGKMDIARGLAGGAIAMAIWSMTPFLPVYTPWRGRILRVVKWAALLAMLSMLGFQWSWLFISCLSWMGWMEWTRVSIRRKMPVQQWPKQLYL
jgi:hypothetical protein